MSVLARKADVAPYQVIMAACLMTLLGIAVGGIGAQWLFLALPVFLVAVMVSVVAGRRNREARERNVVFASDGIQIEGEPLIPVAVISGGFFVADAAQGGRLRLSDDAGQTILEVRVADEAEADTLLAALGRDPATTRAHFEAAPPAFVRTGNRGLAVVASLVCTVGADFARAHVPVAVGLALAALWFFAQALVPASSIEVGVDGVVLSWASRVRFVPLDSIVEVVTVKSHVELHLRSSETIRIAFQSSEPGGEAAARNAFVLRLKAVLARRSNGSRTSSLLARGERTVSEWATALASASEGSGYRDVGLGVDDLAAAVRDPSSSADVRFAAAWLLARREDGGKARVRVAIEAIAEPLLRVAIDEAAEFDDFEDAWTATKSFR